MDGAAEVAAGEVAEEDHVLRGQRLVEAQLAPDAQDLAGGRVGGQQQRHRIAGQAHDHEDHGGHEPERDEGAEEALTEERDESAHIGDLATTLSPVPEERAG